MMRQLAFQSTEIGNGLVGVAPVVRHLSDLTGCFTDPAALERLVAETNPPVYQVSSIEHSQGEGALHVGLGVLLPGKVDNEYFLTRGHIHVWRESSEVYIAQAGEGLILVENPLEGLFEALPFVAGTVVYVPGGAAHRTINTGTAPLVYYGVYPARAGHDYTAAKMFRQAVIEVDGRPQVINREL